MALTTAERSRLEDIKRRHTDLRKCHGDDIENKRFLRMSAEVIVEAEWLAELVEKLEGRRQEKPEKAVA